MDTVVWQTEEFPRADHFLHLLLLCGADVEERRDHVGEQAEEGESQGERQDLAQHNQYNQYNISKCDYKCEKG